MEMVPFTDSEAFTFARPLEQPRPRFGSEHIVRDEVPPIQPEILDFMDRQESHEAELITRLAEERRAQIAVADTVELRLEAFSS